MNSVYNSGKAIGEWLEGLGLTVFRTVPPVQTPIPSEYVVFTDYSTTSFDTYSQPISIYVKGTTSYKRVSEIADIIGEAVTVGGTVLYDNSMAIRIEKGSPFYQDKPDVDDTIRSGIVNLTITNY